LAPGLAAASPVGKRPGKRGGARPGGLAQGAVLRCAALLRAETGE